MQTYTHQLRQVRDSLTLEKDKLSEAAKWAEENEEFLQNN
jgi:hypothetical protein